LKDSLVIIPTYNEIENVEEIIRATLVQSDLLHVLVVDDGSPDGTGQKVKELKSEFDGRLFLIEREGKQGLGTAYLTGFQYALDHQYNFIFEMDADFSHNPGDLLRLRKACSEDGKDLAVGSRYIKGVNVVNWPMSRVLMSYCASIYVRFITGMPIMDATAGFICYKRELLSSFDFKKIKFVGYAFQIEMKFRAWKNGFKITEVPIIFTDRTRGESKMSSKIFKEAFFGVIWLKVSSWGKSFAN
jgi:dolichol-phosphate mannosyltransferase